MKRSSGPERCFPAGWPLRDLSLDEFETLLSDEHPGCLELSKDFVESRSIKKTADIVRKHLPSVLSFAGTTDFCGFSGLTENEYHRYLRIQFAEAAFLGSTMFRVLVGDDPALPPAALRSRLCRAQELLGGIELVVETHGGRESDLDVLLHLLASGSFRFVIDISNVGQSDTVEFILSEELSERIAYFHVRNLGDYFEDEVSSAREMILAEKYPEHWFLFEPKRVSGAAAVQIARGFGSE